MCRENPSWGAPRIHSELLKFGIDIGESSVSKYMVRNRKLPSQTWRTFLENHAHNWSPSTCSRCLLSASTSVPNENSVRPASDAIPRGEAKSVSRSRPRLSLANEIRRHTRVQVSTVRTLISKPRGGSSQPGRLWLVRQPVGGRSVQPRLDLVSCYQQTEASRSWTSLDKFLKWKSQKQLRSKSI